MTKTSMYEVSNGVVVGVTLAVTWEVSSHPKRALRDLPHLFRGKSHSDEASKFCPNVRVHWLPRC